jgi:hypothetical protein
MDCVEKVAMGYSIQASSGDGGWEGGWHMLRNKLPLNWVMKLH